MPKATSTPAKPQAAFRKGHGIGQVGRPSDAGEGMDARADGRTHQRHPEVLCREQPPGHSGDFPRGVPARSCRDRRHQLPAADRSRRHVRSGTGGAAICDDGPGSPRPRRPPGADAGGGRGARPALGPRRGDLWRGSLPGFPHGNRRRARVSRATRTFRDKNRVIATLKHFAAHGQPESGMNCAPANVRERVLRETFLYPFEAGHSAGRGDQRDGVLQRDRRRPVSRQPLAAARRAAQGVGLRGLRRFRLLRHLGAGLPARNARPFVAKDKKEACVLAVEAGVNIELPEPDCYLHLVELVRKGVLKESRTRRARRADAAVEVPHGALRRSLRRSGRGGTRSSAAMRIAGWRCEAARETITLLKNEGGLAPLDPGALKTHCGHRPQCRSHAARRLQRHSQAQRHRAGGHPGQGRANGRKCSTAKAARSPSAARGSRTRSCSAIPKRTAS